MRSRNGVHVNGYEYLVDQSTGEAVDAVNVTVEVGSLIYTPEQQEQYKQRKALEAERKAKAEERKRWRKSAGGFSFVSSDTFYKDVSPATAARLVYLATFLGYDGALKISHRMPMKRDDLQDVLRISQAQTYRFWNETRDRYIHEGEDGKLFMCKEFFARGKLPIGGNFQKVYGEAVRKLYRETETTKHRYLGAVFQLLPYVNVEFNVLCHNPDEQDMDAVRPMTIDELCTAMGYSTANRSRLIKAYSAITFPVEGKRECFCAFVTTNGKQREARMFVNPRVLYRGKRPDEVQLLGKFCEP